MSILTIEQQRGKARLANEKDGKDCDDTECKTEGRLSEKLTRKQLEDLLVERVQSMKDGGEDGGITDQYRVYHHIVSQLEQETTFLRLMVQASAGIFDLKLLFVCL